MATIDEIRAKAAEIDDAVESTAESAKRSVTVLVVGVDEGGPPGRRVDGSLRGQFYAQVVTLADLVPCDERRPSPRPAVEDEQQEQRTHRGPGRVAFTHAAQDVPGAEGKHGRDPRLAPMSQSTIKVVVVIVVLGMVLAGTVTLLALFF
jgi:hypothetical protein